MEIESYYVLTGQKTDGSHVYYAIDHHSGGYPYWSTTFGCAEQYADLALVDQIGAGDYMRKEVVKISVEEITVTAEIISTEEIISQAKAKMMAEIDEMKKQLEKKTKALQAMLI